MTTQRLYYDDAYLTEFDAQVVSVRPDGWVALNRTAFYPTSGGQPFDTGMLLSAGAEIAVTDVTVENGVVWHRLASPLPEGTAVHGCVDWARRWDHMQQHAGDHMLAGAIWQEMGGVTIGLHTGSEDSSIDVSMPGGRVHLTDEEIDSLEALVNRRVQQDDPIRCWFPTAEELAALPLRKRPTVREHVRVVAMGDYEMVPCGGTHPNTTGQIGPVKILSCAPAKGNLRLRFVAGMRAVRLFQQAARSAHAAAAMLSCGIGDVPQALSREREAQVERRKDMEKRLLQAALHWIRAEAQGEMYASHLPFADGDTLHRAASELTKEPDAAVFLSCPRGAERQLVFARGERAAGNMGQIMKQCGARGGGRPGIAQGSAPDGEALRRAAEAWKTLLCQK